VIERNGSDCKHVEIFTHRVGSIGPPSRRTAGRNTKTNIFQKGSTGFKTTTDLNKKKVHRGLVSVYVKFVDSISLKHYKKNNK
jgi:hypothetical protein